MRVRVKKREKSYRVTAILGHNGKGNEIRKTYTRHTRREADALASQLLEQAALHTYSSDTRTTFAAVAARWLQGKVNLRPTTYAQYEQMLRLHILPALADVRLIELSPLHVQGAIAAVAAKGVSPKTVRHVYTVLHALLAQAARWRLLGSNPCELIDAPRVPRREAAAWTTEQMVRYLAAAEGESLYALLYLTVGTGLRRGEVLGLRWSDVDLAAGKLRVSRAVTFVGGHFAFSEPKTPGSIRTIALSHSTVDVLRAHRGNVLPLADRLVFASRNDTPIHTRTLQRAHEKAIAGAGLPYIPFHGLRHTHATLLMGENVPAKVVGERLGHANVQTTLDVYSHLQPNMQSEAAMAFDRALGMKWVRTKQNVN